MLDGVRGRLQGVTVRRTASLEARSGRWRARSLVVARPVAEARLAPGSRLAAIRDTHRPTKLFAVGAAVADHFVIRVDPSPLELAGADAAWVGELYDAIGQADIEVTTVVACLPTAALKRLAPLTPPRWLGRFVGGARRYLRGTAVTAPKVSERIADEIGALLDERLA